MLQEKNLALQVCEIDNIATIFSDVSPDVAVDVRDKKGNNKIIKVWEDIPFGHKFAIKEIKKGEQIIKYGEEIGIATQDIKIGEYVHIHNLESIRGRGDWQKEESSK
jgi:altronate dehydratase small subunit